ncbi:pentapeptide repeat-containing protein, partial [Streptomyces sp. NPDC058739]|uniref:pentapeptide repeat-containing protein n=1 Tax=Streptomyces sp. NPDC058739 TaxID=3346618 RepID=UPI0036966A4F
MSYLASLTPGADVDHSGTPFTPELLEALLNALRNPATGIPCLGLAGFCGAQFSGSAGFDGVQFTNEARFDKAQFSAAATFERAQFSRAAWFDRARFSGGA